jgi:hypothetical protein
MGKTVKRMLLDAATAIDRFSLRGDDVRSVEAGRYDTAPKIRVSTLAFEKVFRGTGISITKIKRDDAHHFYFFTFVHGGIHWHTSIDREEVESMDCLLARKQLALPEPSVRINAKSQLLLGQSP